MSSLRLTLYKSDHAYVLDQAIEGTVECFVNTTKTIDAITIAVKGTVRTEWTERESYYNNLRKRTEFRVVRYFSKDNCFYQEIRLQGEVELTPGSHVYPFSIMLPSGGLPSSYTGTYGSIRYQIKATVSRSWNTNLVEKIPLRIYAPLNLNNLSHLRNPATISSDKTLVSCCCRDNGILVFNMSLPVIGYVPGQEIHIGAHVQNLTNVSAENVQFRIIQDLEFSVRIPSYKARYMKNVIATRTESGIGAHGEKSWTSILKIPTQGNYPNFDNCRNMKVGYRLKATVILPFPHSNLENEIPLVIGGTPLIGVSTGFTAEPPPEYPRVHAASAPEASGVSSQNEPDKVVLKFF